LEDIGKGKQFQPVLRDPIANADKAKRVLLVSGKLFYELVKERQARNLNDTVAIIRIEELAPFPFRELSDVLQQYANAAEYYYLQEEPKNQGAYPHVKERIEVVLSRLGCMGQLEYKGRMESAIPAPGISKVYLMQQQQILSSAFD
jgi:probable 2-oxoglutarate dehydrogenase E1 component DHKTD1